MEQNCTMWLNKVNVKKKKVAFIFTWVKFFVQQIHIVMWYRYLRICAIYILNSEKEKIVFTNNELNIIQIK